VLEANIRERVLEILDRSASPKDTLLICVDGPAGSGKTTLAHEIAEAFEASVIPMDDLYDGWSGSFTAELVSRIHSSIIDPLRMNLPARYQRYNWVQGRFDEWVTCDVNPLIILEGAGSATRGLRESAALVIWVECEPSLRLPRVLSRDGAGIRAEMEEFQRRENSHFAHDQTREAADLIVERGDC
jgi:uridine kinase